MKKNNNPTNNLRKSTLKTTLAKMSIGALVGAILGGFLGFSHFVLGSDSAPTVAKQMLTSIRTFIFPALIIITIFSILLQEFYFRKLKDVCVKLEDAEDEEFDQLNYEEEKLGSIFQMINISSQVISIVVMSFGYSFDYLTSSILALGSCIVFLICFFYDGCMSARYIRFLQRIHPEKRGDVSSFNFQKQWLDSCDEAEKEVIYQSAYESYIFINKIIALLLLITMLGHLFLHTGILAIVVVGIIYFTLSLTYCRSCMRLKREKVNG